MLIREKKRIVEVKQQSIRVSPCWREKPCDRESLRADALFICYHGTKTTVPTVYSLRVSVEKDDEKFSHGVT